MNVKPVGPVDVSAWLADVKAGKVAPRTASVEVFLNPHLADEYDSLVDEYNALIESDTAASKEEMSIGDGPADHAAELDALEARMDAVKADADSSKAVFTFRTYRPGDQKAIADLMADAGITPENGEELAILGTAQYCTNEPPLTADDVRAMVPIIGYAQFNRMCEAWQTLVYGAPTGPKLRKPLRTRGTETL